MPADPVDAGPRELKILVAESKWTGHHLFFARAIAKALAAADHEVILAVTESTEAVPRRMVELATGDLSDGRIVIRRTLAGPEAGFARIDDRNGRIEVDAISKQIGLIKPDRVVIPSADAAAFSLGGRSSAHDLLRSEETLLILHQPYVGYRGRGVRFAVRRTLIRRRLRSNAARLAALDHRVARAMGSRHPVSILPHHASVPVDVPRIDARRRFGIRHDRPVFLAAGEHSRRKGTDGLVEAWPVNAEGTLLIVGFCSDEVRAIIANRPQDLATGRIRVLDETVDDETYSTAFEACDVVTVCYPRHFGASGILGAAVQTGRAILGSNYGYIGDCIRTFGLGAEVDCRDSNAVATALHHAIRRPPSIDPDRSRPFREFHTPGNFQRHVQMLVGGRTSDGVSPVLEPRP